MNRIITFTSDFGDRDWFVGAVKAEILKINGRARIVDVTHKIAPGDIAAAAFVLKAVFKNFPAGTVHLAVVDPGVGSARKPLIIAAGGYFFVGPDNGIFSFVYRQPARAYAISGVRGASGTFHGRDIFGPAAARLSRGTAPSRLGVHTDIAVKLEFPAVRETGEKIIGQVVYVDNFGNLITNIPNRKKIRYLRVEKNRTIQVGEMYCRAREAGLIAVPGSTGYYEIACFRGSAAKKTGLGRGAKVVAS